MPLFHNVWLCLKDYLRNLFRKSKQFASQNDRPRKLKITNTSDDLSGSSFQVVYLWLPDTNIVYL